MYIKGIGSALPRRSWKNSELDLPIGIDDEWIYSRTGIRSRRIAGPDETTLSLAVSATMRALKDAGVSAHQIDLVLVCTATPDDIVPSTAAQLQHHIQAENAAAFDIKAACAGFIYGLHIARAFILSGMSKYVVLACSETLSRVTNRQDVGTFALFGDGAAAVVLSSDSGIVQILDTHIHSDGGYRDLLYIPSVSNRDHLTEASLQSRNTVSMEGRPVFRHAVRRMKEACTEMLASNLKTLEDIDLVIAHQANMRLIERLALEMSIPKRKLRTNIEAYGNTGSAAIPILLETIVASKSYAPKATVLSTAFGSGFVWGAALLTFC
jgi:3-oxoacyl-[acyl-carrier-protein] synthase-3